MKKEDVEYRHEISQHEREDGGPLPVGGGDVAQEFHAEELPVNGLDGTAA